MARSNLKNIKLARAMGTFLIYFVSLSSIPSAADTMTGLILDSSDGATSDSSGDDEIVRAAESHAKVHINFTETRNETTGNSLKIKVGKKTVWVDQPHLKPITLDGKFRVLSQPSSGARSLGVLAEAELVDDVVLTGQSKEVTDEKGKSKWYEVVFKGESGWVSAKAIQAAPPVAAAPARGTPVNKAPSSGPACISSYSEAQRNPRFQSLVQKSNPFTRWSCNSISASVDVYPSGQAVFHHPLKGDIPINVSLCLDSRDRAYVSLNGGGMTQHVNFADSGMNVISVTDPSSGSAYQFVKAQQ